MMINQKPLLENMVIRKPTHKIWVEFDQITTGF